MKKFTKYTFGATICLQIWTIAIGNQARAGAIEDFVNGTAAAMAVNTAYDYVTTGNVDLRKELARSAVQGAITTVVLSSFSDGTAADNGSSPRAGYYDVPGYNTPSLTTVRSWGPNATSYDLPSGRVIAEFSKPKLPGAKVVDTAYPPFDKDAVKDSGAIAKGSKIVTSIVLSSLELPVRDEAMHRVDMHTTFFASQLFNGDVQVAGFNEAAHSDGEVNLVVYVNTTTILPSELARIIAAHAKAIKYVTSISIFPVPYQNRDLTLGQTSFSTMIEVVKAIEPDLYGSTVVVGEMQIKGNQITDKYSRVVDADANAKIFFSKKIDATRKSDASNFRSAKFLANEVNALGTTNIGRLKSMLGFFTGIFFRNTNVNVGSGIEDGILGNYVISSQVVGDLEVDSDFSSVTEKLMEILEVKELDKIEIDRAKAVVDRYINIQNKKQLFTTERIKSEMVNFVAVRSMFRKQMRVAQKIIEDRISLESDRQKKIDLVQKAYDAVKDHFGKSSLPQFAIKPGTCNSTNIVLMSNQ